MDHKEGDYKVRDLALADEGRMLIEWAESRMPVMMSTARAVRARRSR